MHLTCTDIEAKLMKLKDSFEYSNNSQIGEGDKEQTIASQ